MKIGILTYHYACNFGANLQVLSTVGHLRRRGHVPVVINWRPQGIERLYRGTTPAMQVEAHRGFAEAFLPMTAVCRSPAEIAAVIAAERIEAVIVGSDAVAAVSPRFARLGFSGSKVRFIIAKAESVNELPNPFWGSFLLESVTDVPCAMMSVSSQNTRYRLMSPRQRKVAEESLRRFRYVSVRDSWTKGMMEWLSRGACRPEVTPDPVFAFNANVPSVVANPGHLDSINLPEKYVLVSFKEQHCPPREWVSAFARLCEKRGVTAIALPYPQGLCALGLERQIGLPLNPLTWYSLIARSAGYVGHNMHPVVCCIHNAVPFFSFDNYGYLSMKMFSNTRSSKIYDLLRATRMLDRRCSAIRRFPRWPAPEAVLDRLLGFDRESCAGIAADMQGRYEVMMTNLLASVGAEPRA